MAYIGLFMAIPTNACKDGPLNADWGCQVEHEPWCASRLPRAVLGSHGGTPYEQLLSEQQQASPLQAPAMPLLCTAGRRGDPVSSPKNQCIMGHLAALRRRYSVCRSAKAVSSSLVPVIIAWSQCSACSTVHAGMVPADCKTLGTLQCPSPPAAAPPRHRLMARGRQGQLCSSTSKPTPSQAPTF